MMISFKYWVMRILLLYPDSVLLTHDLNKIIPSMWVSRVAVPYTIKGF